MSVPCPGCGCNCCAGSCSEVCGRWPCRWQYTGAGFSGTICSVFNGTFILPIDVWLPIPGSGCDQYAYNISSTDFSVTLHWQLADPVVPAPEGWYITLWNPGRGYFLPLAVAVYYMTTADFKCCETNVMPAYPPYAGAICAQTPSITLTPLDCLCRQPSAPPPAPHGKRFHGIPCSVGLGDTVKTALAAVGITEERVRKYFKNCGCEERREKLNAFGAWANRVLKGGFSHAAEYLERMMQ
jgi:hypothetical protein